MCLERSLRGRRSGSHTDPDHVLGEDPRDEGLGDFFVEDTHSGGQNQCSI